MWRLGAIRPVLVWGVIANCLAGLALVLLGVRSQDIPPLLGNVSLIAATLAGGAFGYFSWLGGTIRDPPRFTGVRRLGRPGKRVQRWADRAA